MPRNISYDRTIPNTSAAEAAQELLDEMPEVGDPSFRGRPASIQRFRSAEEQRQYLRLIKAFEGPRAWTASEIVALGLLTAGLGALVGWWWREHRKKVKTRSAHIGLDLLGAS